MTRRSIMDEAEEGEEGEASTGEGADGEDDSSEGSGSDGRKQITQRSPHDLVGDVEEFATEMGMSRNSAVNLLLRKGLDQMGWE